jgi:hypothetical protein
MSSVTSRDQPSAVLKHTNGVVVLTADKLTDQNFFVCLALVYLTVRVINLPEVIEHNVNINVKAWDDGRATHTQTQNRCRLTTSPLLGCSAGAVGPVAAKREQRASVVRVPLTKNRVRKIRVVFSRWLEIEFSRWPKLFPPKLAFLWIATLPRRPPGAFFNCT